MSEKMLKLCLLMLCMGLLCAYRSPASAVPANKRWRAVRNKVPIDRSKTPKLFDLRGGNNGLGFGGGKPPSCSALTASHDNEPANSGNSQAAAGPFGFILSLLKRLVELYNDTINKYPMRTKVISSAVVGGLGDLLIQTLTRKKAGLPWGLDVRRFAVFTTVAGLYIAPVINAWFTWLTKLPTGSSSKFVQAAVMMLVDQTAGAVLINAGFFFAFELAQRAYPPYHTHNVVQALGDAWRAGLESSTKNMWVTLVANWYCWPVINFANFLFVPLQYRLLFSNVAAVFWNMFLSSVANNDAK